MRDSRAVAHRAVLLRSRFFLFCGRPHICKAVSHGRTPRESTRRMFDNRGRPPRQRHGMRRKLSSSSSRLPAIRRGRWRYVGVSRKPPFTATGFNRDIIAPSYKICKIWGDNSWGGADEGVGWRRDGDGWPTGGDDNGCHSTGVGGGRYGEGGTHRSRPTEVIAAIHV